MDGLSYDYAGNQLKSVNDNKIDTEGFKDGSNTDDDYTYDLNGNMSMDKNKGLNANSITYNHLNLTQLVQKSPTEYVQYTFDAMGRKLKQVAAGDGTKTTDYVGDFVYENNVLQFINHEEGRVVMTGSSPEYQYHLKDHLGNVRTTFTTKGNETETVKATLDAAYENEERSKFLKYDDVRRVNHALFDHTNSGSTKNSVRLTGEQHEKYGLARSIAVMPGDKITARVFAKYVDPNESNVQQSLIQLLSIIAQGPSSGIVVDGSGYNTPTGSTIPFPGLLGGDEPDGCSASILELVGL